MSFKDSILPAPHQWWQIEPPRVPTRVYTVGLHRPNPVAREMPGFIGFFARQGSLAEREGRSPRTNSSANGPVSLLRPSAARRPVLIGVGSRRRSAS
jgi:hypothetical protein